MTTIQKKNQGFPVKRLVMDAMLIAIYVVLGYLRIPIGNYGRISIAPFAVILCALTFGPIDGVIVGFMGEFLTQILGPFGLTPTTVFWCIGETARGLLLGLCTLFLKRMSDGGIKRLVLTLICCVVTGIISALGNTLAFYIDSKMLNYYTYAAVFGVMWVRICIYIVTSLLLGYICTTIMKVLRKTNLI